MTRKALYISAFIPDPTATHAGGQAAHQNRVNLQHEGFDVTTLVCTTEANTRPAVADESFIRQTRIQVVAGWIKNFLQGQTTGIMAWPILDTRANRIFEHKIQEEILNGNHSVVFIDFTQAFLPAWRALRKAAGSNIQIRVCVHDLFIQKLLRAENLSSSLFLAAVARTERKILQSADLVVTLNPKDESLVKLLHDCKNVCVKEFVPPAWVHRVRRTDVQPHTALFFANFSRPENAEALAWFTKTALPQIVSCHPDFRLVLAGFGSDKVRVDADETYIQRTGFVEDPSSLFSNCRLAIAPLALGAGVKFKVLEAIAAGVPVLGTPIAFEGVAQSELMIEATRKNFTHQLLHTLRA